MDVLNWDSKEKASSIWYLVGLFSGVGYLIAMIYVLITNNKNRIWSLFYLLSPIGSIILYLVFKDTDKKFADMSMKLLIGWIIEVVVVIALLGTFFIV